MLHSTHKLMLVAVAALASASAAQAQQFQYTFGMSVSLRYAQGSPVLYVESVNFGSPAQQAGLEVGDQILSVNGRTFEGAQNDLEGIRILQDATANPSGGGGGTPTLLVATNPGTARMLVVDRNSGQITAVVATPIDNYNGGGGGTPTAFDQVLRNSQSSGNNVQNMIWRQLGR